MDFLNYEYQGKVIEFLMADDLMINATEMAAVFGKRPVDFLETKGAKELIAGLELRTIGDFNGSKIEQLNAGNALFKIKKIVESANFAPILITAEGKEHGGTWMHRWLAIDFAMYLDVDFKIWILERIDYLFISFAKSHRQLVIKENQLIKERQKILAEHSNDPVIQKLAVVDDELKEIRNKKSSETRKTYKGWTLGI
ncbi:MAG: hypothetical protein JWP44_2635 [Mucilaginibacter sp.]|nr:hypothetical protein [Mucilaginibacter sp.]